MSSRQVMLVVLSHLCGTRNFGAGLPLMSTNVALSEAVVKQSENQKAAGSFSHGACDCHRPLPAPPAHARRRHTRCRAG